MMTTKTDLTVTKFFNTLSLHMSDYFSSMLAMNISFHDVVTQNIPYNTITKSLNGPQLTGLLKHDGDGALFVAGLPFTSFLTNRALGGKGIASSSDDATFSESMFSEIFFNTVASFYKEKGYGLDFVRSEHDIALAHYFFPDQTVIHSAFQCKAGDTKLGSVHFIHPMAMATTLQKELQDA